MKLAQIVLLVVVAYPWVTFGNRRRVSFANCIKTNMDIDVLESKPARSRIECSMMCLNSHGCLSASYSKTANGYTCQLTGAYVESNCSRGGADNGSGLTVMTDPCENGGTFYPHNRTCVCPEGFVGHYCQRRYRDCWEAPKKPGFIQYTIQPFGSNEELEWACSSSSVYRSRLADFYVWKDTINANFSLPWQQMKKYCPFFEGFSFFGLENIHQLTKQGVYDLNILLLDSDEGRGHVIYRNLRVDSEAKGYALYWDDVEMSNQYLDGFGGAGDETKNLNGARFGTYDKDVNGCASANNAGWWYNPLGCTMLRFHANGISWPKNRNGTVTVEETLLVIMRFKKVYWYVEDDLVL